MWGRHPNPKRLSRSLVRPNRSSLGCSQPLVATLGSCRAGRCCGGEEAQVVFGRGAPGAVGALAAGRVGQRDRAGARSVAGDGPCAAPPAWGSAAARAAAQPACLDAGRAGGDLARGVAAGASARAIACRLARAPSTVTRELNRHGGRGGYRAAEAERRAWERGRRPQRCKLARQPRLAALVAAKLAADWSPEQIAAWLRAHYPEDETMRVSHETIYLTLFVQARGALKRELLEHLRRAQTQERPQRQARPGTDPRRRLDRRAPSGGGRPGGPGPLGRRPARRRLEQPDRDPGRAAIPLPHPRRRRPQGQPLGHRCAQPPARAPAAAAARLADLGSRLGDGRARQVHRRHRRQGLLLRPA